MIIINYKSIIIIVFKVVSCFIRDFHTILLYDGKHVHQNFK